MAICKNCGCFTKEVMEICPMCGADLRVKAPAPQNQTFDAEPQRSEKNSKKELKKQKPKNKHGKDAACRASSKSAEVVSDSAQKKTQKKKKSKAPLVILLSLLAIILVIGGLAYYLLTRNSGDKDVMTFDMTCAEFTAALNSSHSATSDEAANVKIDVEKWTLNQAHTALEYVGGGFTLKAKTVKTGDVNSKMKELRVGPTDTETGVNMVALSIVTLEKSLEPDAAMRAMSDVKTGVKDKISYEKTAFTYDREKDEFVVVPSKGAKSVANQSATSDEAAFPAVTEVPVSGSGIIKAGGQYIIADGEAIRRRQSITDDNKVIVSDKNNGQILSNGEIIFYVKEDVDKYNVCSVKIDGSQSKTLLSQNENIRLIHIYNDSLYYAREIPDEPDNYVLCSCSLVKAETKEYQYVSFTPDKAVVCGDIMYCSKAQDISEQIKKTSAYKFEFASEKFTEVIPDCTVIPHGYFNGSGNPCFDSYVVNVENETIGEHYLYTSVNGELKKSHEINVNAKLILASPKTDKAILGNSSTGEYYIFDRKTGDCKQLSLPEAEDGYYTFTFDITKPENMYVTYQQGSGDSRTIGKLWMVDDDELIPCTVDSSINCEVDCVITDGYVLDAFFDSYPIKPDNQNGTGESTTSSGEYEKYVGVWSYKAQGNAEHQVRITSVSGDNVTFSVSSNNIMLSREETAENIEVVMNNGKADFTYTDNSGNTGTGTISLDGGAVHMRINSDNESEGVGISFEADLTDHSPLS